MEWLEVSLEVDGEMAEAVAEVLARFAPSGVVIESIELEQIAYGVARPVGNLRVCAYLEVDAQIEETRQRILESLWYLGRIRPLPEPAFKIIGEVNWVETWKQHYKPVPIGERLIIVPAWLDSPDESRLSIRIDPGMAFGTGTHPTTQLCLEFLESYTPQGRDILDIGCGSGILGIAALKLGAARAFGVDVEPESVLASQENAAMNGVAGQLQAALGSVDEIRAGVLPIRQASLVLANILSHILMRLLDAGMGDLMLPEGSLILSGILEEQAEAMRAKLTEHNLQIIEQRQIEDWVALAVKRAA
ncbi:MAG TPA: 50S ribosomal protein L11 methyltransferase [Chloroflexi bacterium]|nr:50S ribosomal protein L11 methyltransferase [Chloroflexota bacterium]HBY08709.1 50S ribosomal protein L11 methyltransferase [Chloroflexota bacterium]